MTMFAQRALWTATAALLGALALLALVVAPPDRVQGDAQRLMYLHVPAAWIAYVAFCRKTLTRKRAMPGSAYEKSAEPSRCS